MPQSHYLPELSPQENNWPTCPMCESVMYIALVEPDKPDHDRRTLCCPTCEYSETIVVKYK
jgi:hypothetical protein